MQITLKLYASLSAFLPSGAVKNSVALDVDRGSSVGAVLDSHNVPQDMCHLVLVNGVFTPPRSSHSKTLSEGDVVAVWPPVAGG